MKSLVIKALCAMVSAVLLWAAFSPAPETVNVVVALAPMLVLARICRPRAAAGWFFLFGFLFWVPSLSWMLALAHNNGPLPLVILGWLGLAAVCGAYFALFGFLDALAFRRLPSLAAVFAEAILWAGIEYLRATLFTGFAWNFLGTAFAGLPSFAAPAALGGVYLVSALVVLVNGVFATVSLRALAPVLNLDADARPRWLKSLETAIPLALVLLVLSAARAHLAARADSAAAPLRVALIQRNADCIFKRGPRENPYTAFGNLLENAAVAKPDLLVFAESAMSEFGDVLSAPARQAALHFLNKTGARALLAGGDEKDRPANRLYNAAALYTESSGTNATDVITYRKRHLVPFGEYIPFDKTITSLQSLSPVGVSLWPGSAPTLDWPPIRLAPLICYEDTDPTLARAAARDGAQLIIIITNDSWFSRSQEAAQHARQSILRAIETALPIVRVGNSGVTGVISPEGTARFLTDADGKPLVGQRGVLVESVTPAAGTFRTWYVRLGDLPLLALFILSLFFIFAPILTQRRKNITNSLH